MADAREQGCGGWRAGVERGKEKGTEEEGRMGSGRGVEEGSGCFGKAFRQGTRELVASDTRSCKERLSSHDGTGCRMHKIFNHTIIHACDMHRLA